MCTDISTDHIAGCFGCCEKNPLWSTEPSYLPNLNVIYMSLNVLGTSSNVSTDMASHRKVPCTKIQHDKVKTMYNNAPGLPYSLHAIS